MPSAIRAYRIKIEEKPDVRESERKRNWEKRQGNIKLVFAKMTYSIGRIVFFPSSVPSISSSIRAVCLSLSSTVLVLIIRG